MSTKKIKKYYDVVVIGGGIQGAGIALVAKAAGYSVLLVEKNQWASGTSSKSSKLIHGGLRYLQTGQFKLVYECLAERKWVLKTMPDLVRPNWFYIPIYKNSYYSRWKIHIGLCLYRWLSGNTRYSQYKKIPKSEWDSLSGLKQDDLIAVFAYQDAQTDDAMLTRAVIQHAEHLGADCLEATELLSMKQVEGNSQACLTLKAGEGSQVEVDCHTVINATGPWVNETLGRLNQKVDFLPIDLVQGSHLVVSPPLSSTCFYLEAPQDNRAVFCLPWKGGTMIGTTELNFKGKPEDAVATEAETDYLMAVVRHYFPHYEFSVESQFCGLRVLPASNKKAFFRSRDTIIQRNQNVISLYGGKLTAWRVTAGKVLNDIDKHFGRTSAVDLNNIM